MLVRRMHVDACEKKIERKYCSEISLSDYVHSKHAKCISMHYQQI